MPIILIFLRFFGFELRAPVGQTDGRTEIRFTGIITAVIQNLAPECLYADDAVRYQAC